MLLVRKALLQILKDCSKKLIGEFGNNTDRYKLMQFEEHRRNYFINMNRLRTVPRANELYSELGLRCEIVLLLFSLIQGGITFVPTSGEWSHGLHQ